MLLCLLFTTWLACRSGEEGIAVVLRRRGWKYVILAAFDVEANYLVVKAYNYTTLTSITVSLRRRTAWSRERTEMRRLVWMTLLGRYFGCM